MIDLSFFNARRGWAAAIILVAGATAHSAARAETTYTLGGEFTSFRTWLPTTSAIPASVAGVALVDTGAFAGIYNGQSFNWSQKVLLPVLTRSVDFTYLAVPPDQSIYDANNFSFTAGANVSVNPGVPFAIGSISFTNGQWFYRAELEARFSATPIGGGPANIYDDTIVLC
jgi:hypothetical protein